jgi:anti-sigma regulatory factor (Ser/Thr protein kinase)
MESFMDELDVRSQPGVGTTVRMRKRLIPDEMPLARNA